MADQRNARELVHTLRNHLSVILSAANAIRKANYDREIGDEMVEMIRSNVDQANQLLEELGEQREHGGA